MVTSVPRRVRSAVPVPAKAVDKDNRAQELGSHLQAERLARRLTLSQVAMTLNIPRKQLEGIENGDFSVFGAEIYARGACLKYARFLGMHGEESERLILRALASGRQLVPLKIHTTSPWFERLWHARLVLWAGIACAALIVGGYIAWQVRSFWQLPELALTSPIPVMQTDKVLKVVGKTQPETKVTINDEPVILKQDASFEAEVRLHPGVTVIRVEAENAAGRKLAIEKRVLLQL